MGVNRKFDFRRVWKFCWDLSNVISDGNWLFRWDCVFSGGTSYPSPNHGLRQLNFCFKSSQENYFRWVGGRNNNNNPKFAGSKHLKDCIHTEKTYIPLMWRFFGFKSCPLIAFMILLKPHVYKKSGSWVKGTVMQIEKALINDCVCISRASWKFCIPTVYNFAIIYPRNLLFS